MKINIWTVILVGQAKKYDKNLSLEAKKSFVILLKELQSLGPYRFNWPNYTKMNGAEDYHCHLKKGRPTYIACWVIRDKNNKVIEVYYAGTHEKSPY